MDRGSVGMRRFRVCDVSLGYHLSSRMCNRLDDPSVNQSGYMSVHGSSIVSFFLRVKSMTGLDDPIPTLQACVSLITLFPAHLNS
jgi:hypothetical protein